MKHGNPCLSPLLTPSHQAQKDAAEDKRKPGKVEAGKLAKRLLTKLLLVRVMVVVGHIMRHFQGLSLVPAVLPLALALGMIRFLERLAGLAVCRRERSMGGLL